MVDRKNLLIKTFSANTKEEIDKLVNDFSIENEIMATHTQIQRLIVAKEGIEEIRVFYDYTVFYLPKDQLYKDKEIKQPTKEIKKEMKECPGCKILIPIDFEYHLKCGWKKNEK